MTDSPHVEAFVLYVRPGRIEAYRQRHEAVWPDLIAALRATGVLDYELFLDDGSGRVFGRMVRSRRLHASTPEAPAVLEWRRSMADILEMDGERPRRDELHKVFDIDAIDPGARSGLHGRTQP